MSKQKEKKDEQSVWFNILDTLAQGDITKYDVVLDMNIIMCLNKIVLDRTYRNSYTNLKLYGSV